MKKYIKPVIEYIKIRTEERLATCTKDGACKGEEYNIGGIVYITFS